MRTPQPSTAVGISVVPSSAGRGDLLVQLLLEGVLGEPVARRLPASRPADGEEARMLSGAVVVDRARRAAFLLPALEVVLGGRSLREQAAHGRDLRRLGAVRRAGDGDLPIIQVGPGAGEQERLDRLRARAKEADKRGIAGGRDHLAVPDGDGVDAVARLDGVPAAHGYADCLDGEETKDALAAGRPVAARQTS